MKNLQRIATISLILIFAKEAESQNLYVLNLSDTSNFSTSCGTVTSAVWSVKNSYCSLKTKNITYPGNAAIDPPMIAPVSISFKSTGNLSCGEIYPDGIFIRYSVNNGSWYTQSSISACAFNSSNITNNTISENFKLYAPAGATVKIMVTIVVSQNNDKIWIQDGGISIGTPVVSTPSTWAKRISKHNTPAVSSAHAATVETHEPEFKVYPNPSNGQGITLSLNNSKGMESLVVLYDVMGREVYSKVIINSNGGFLHAIDPSNALVPGVYLIVGTSQNEIYKEKLIIR